MRDYSCHSFYLFILFSTSSRFSPAVNTRKHSASKTTTNHTRYNRSTSRDRHNNNKQDSATRGRMRSISAQRRERALASRSVSRERSISGSSLGMRTPSPGIISPKMNKFETPVQLLYTLRLYLKSVF